MVLGPEWLVQRDGTAVIWLQPWHCRGRDSSVYETVWGGNSDHADLDILKNLHSLIRDEGQRQLSQRVIDEEENARIQRAMHLQLAEIQQFDYQLELYCACVRSRARGHPQKCSGIHGRDKGGAGWSAQLDCSPGLQQLPVWRAGLPRTAQEPAHQ